MSTQIITATAKTLTIKLKSGNTTTFKAPKTWSQFMDVMAFLAADKDCKAIADAYRGSLTDEQYVSLRKGFFPTLTDKKIQVKKTKAAQKRMAKDEAKIEALQKWQSSHSGFLGNGLTRKDAQESAPSEVLSIYGL